MKCYGLNGALILLFLAFMLAAFLSLRSYVSANRIVATARAISQPIYSCQVIAGELFSGNPNYQI